MTTAIDDSNPAKIDFDDLNQVDAVVRGSKLELNEHVMETYQAFFKAMPEGTATLSQDGIILHCNTKLLQLLGEVASSEILGMPFVDCLSQMHREQFHRMLGDSTVTVADLLLRRSDGATVPVQISANRLQVDGMRLICLMVVDLTDRRQLELERHKFVSLAENSLDFIAIFDQNLGLHYINPHGLRMVGVEDLSQLLHSPFCSLFFEEDQTFIVDQLREQVILQGAVASELRLRQARSVEPIWVSMNFFSIQDTQNQPIGFACILRDITTRKFIEDRLRLTSKVFDNSLESVIISGADGRIVEVNNAFSRMTGYERDEVIGRDPRLLQSGEHDANFYRDMWQSIAHYGYWSGEICNKRKSGEKFIEWLSISTVRNDEGQVLYYVALATDITVYKHHQKQLEHIAHYDVLTDIPNRVLLSDRLKCAIAQTRRDKKLLAICYLDLDGFKPINDEMGHDAGDQVLITITRRIQQTIRSSDTVARMGGDEFVILLLGIEFQDECRLSLQRLLDVIAKPVKLHERSFSVTASIGVTLFPNDEVDQDSLLRHADQAMYSAKQMGKNRYYFYDVVREREIKSLVENKRRLLQAFDNAEFVLYFQPKIELASMRPTGVEALIRWQHPEQGLLPPGHFMGLIENAELEVELGEFVIENSLRQANLWHVAGLNLDISINIAAKHMQAKHFTQHLQQVLRAYPNLPRGILQIEVLESTALEDIASVSMVIESCKNLGISFALDDFGTGYSTLTYLRNLPADTLKIDQSFVRGMLADNGDLAIVQSIIALAKTFKRKIIAEGVETEAHIHLLNSLGCGFAQGYGIARPMPAEQIQVWFDEWSGRRA